VAVEDDGSRGPAGEEPGRESSGEAQGAKRKAFLLRLPPDLWSELRGWSNQELRSLNAHIEYLLRDALRRRKGSGEDAE